MKQKVICKLKKRKNERINDANKRQEQVSRELAGN